MNVLALTARTTAKPEIQTKDETTWCRFRVAHYDRRRDETNFFNVVAFGKIAEIAAKLEKGELFSFSGGLESSQWEDSEGNSRESTHLKVEEITFHGSKKTPEDSEEPGS